MYDLRQHTEEVTRGLEQSLPVLRAAELRLQGIAETKPYRLAYLLRRLTFDLIQGSKEEKRQVLGWLLSRLCGRQSPYKRLNNPLFDSAALISQVTETLTDTVSLLQRTLATLAPVPGPHNEPVPFASLAFRGPRGFSGCHLTPYRQLVRTAATLSPWAQRSPAPARVLTAFARLPRVRVLAMTPGTGAAIYAWLCTQTWPAWVLQTTDHDVAAFRGNSDPRLVCNFPAAVPWDVTWDVEVVPVANAVDSLEYAVLQWLVCPEAPFPGVTIDRALPPGDAAPLPSDALRVSRDVLPPLLVTTEPVPEQDWAWLQAAAMRNPGCYVVTALAAAGGMAVALPTYDRVLAVPEEQLEAYQKLAHALVTTPTAPQARAKQRAADCGKWLLAPEADGPLTPFLAPWGADRPVPAVWRCPQPGDWPGWQQQWVTDRAEVRTANLSSTMQRTGDVPAELRNGWIGLWVDRLDKGGLEGVVAHLATSLSQRGLQVRILCSLAGGHTAERLRAEGIPVMVFHGDEGKFTNYLRADPPVVLNSQYVHHFLHIPKALEIQTVEVIQNVYGFFSEERWGVEANLRAPSFAHFIAVSSLAKDYYVAHNVQLKPEAVTVVPNTVDYQRVDRVNRPFVEACLGFPTDECRFICVGTIEPRKNQLGVLRAFVTFCQQTPGCRARLMFVGSVMVPSYWEQLRAEMANASLPEGCVVEYEDFRADVLNLQAAADCCVVGAYLEGLSLAASEALALGKRLIHTQTGGAEELCADGLGIMVPNPGGEPMHIALATLYDQEPVPAFVPRLVEAFAGVYATSPAEQTTGERRSVFLRRLNGVLMTQGYLRVLATCARRPQPVRRARHTAGAVLLLCTRNVSYPNAELSLIANRAQAMHALTGSATHLLAFQAEGLLPHRQPAAVNAPYFRTEAFLSIPNLSRASNEMAAEVMQRAWSAYVPDKAPDVVVLSSWPHYLPAFRALLPCLQEFRQRTGARLVYDMHASVDEAWEYNLSLQGGEGYPFFKEIVQAEEDILNAMDGAFVVSHALRDYIGMRHYLEGPLQCFRIPCGVHTPFASPAQMRQARARWRRDLGIEERELIFVYSGGLGPWQMLEESLALFFGTWSQALQARLCIFTGERDAVLQHVRAMGYDESRLILRSFSPGDVVAALTSADVGLLFRQDNWTNRVAFPNKFSEYLAGGLVVLTTKALRDPAAILQDGAFGLAVDDVQALSLDAIQAVAAARQADLDTYYRRALAACQSTLSYEKNSQEFVDWLRH